MKKKAIIVLVFLITLICGIFIGTQINPKIEYIEVEKEVEVIKEILVDKENIIEKYQKKFIDIEDELKNSYTEDAYIYVQNGMNIKAANEAKRWDDLLNEIYSELKIRLTEEEMNLVAEEQIDWIKRRDSTAEDVANNYEGGSMAPMMISYHVASFTKNRCAELMVKYMK